MALEYSVADTQTRSDEAAPSPQEVSPQETSPLERFVAQVRARREAVGRMDWSPPGDPPEMPEFKSNRLRWEPPGAANQKGVEPISLEELREQMPITMKQYLTDKSRKEALLVRVAAGGGKTHAALHVAQWAVRELGWRVLWVGGRHDMFDQLELIDAFDPALWYHWLPIQVDDDYLDDPVKTTCRYGREQQIWAGKGYSAIDLCERLCRFDGHRKVCPYRCQAQRKERIVYAMHQHLASGLAISNFRLVIVDENPLGAFVGERTLSLEDLSLKAATGPLGKLLEQLRWKIVELMGESGFKTLSGRKLLDVIGATLNDTYAQIEVNPDAIPLPPQIWSPEHVANAPAWFVMDLLENLVLEVQAWEAGWSQWAERVWLGRDGLHLLQRAMPWQKLPGKMIVLDATANEAFYRQILARPVTTYAPEIQRAGKLYQVTGRLNGKSTMTLKTGKASQQANEALAVAGAIAAPYQAKKQRVCVICAKDVRALFEREFGEQNVGHFYGLRGTNDMQDAACLIVVGAPSPDIQSVIHIATALNPDRQRAYADRDEEGGFQPLFHTTEREYRVSKALLERAEGKAPWRALKGYWTQPELQAVYDQLREAELVQALHRSRVNTNESTVWLLTSVITGESLDGVWDDPPAEAGFPSGIYWKQWLKLKPWIETRQEPITYADLADVTGVLESTARKGKWLNLIRTHYAGEWQIETLARSGTGGGRKALARSAA